MTREEFNEAFDAAHEKAAGMLEKVNETKDNSPFTETLEKKRERIAQWLSDRLDIIFNAAFGENGDA